MWLENSSLKVVLSKFYNCTGSLSVLGSSVGVLLCSVQWKTHSMISLSKQVWCPSQYSLCAGWLKKDSYDNYISVNMVIFELRIEFLFVFVKASASHAAKFSFILIQFFGCVDISSAYTHITVHPASWQETCLFSFIGNCCQAWCLNRDVQYPQTCQNLNYLKKISMNTKHRQNNKKRGR